MNRWTIIVHISQMDPTWPNKSDDLQPHIEDSKHPNSSNPLHFHHKYGSLAFVSQIVPHKANDSSFDSIKEHEEQCPGCELHAGFLKPLFWRTSQIIDSPL